MRDERVAAVGLNRDDELAEPHEAEPERARRSTSRSSAGSPQAASKDCRKSAGRRSKLGLVFGERQRRLERPFGEGGDERRRVADRRPRHSLRRAETLADGDGARRRVEADRIAGAAAARRIVRQHASEALVRRRLAPEVRPAASELGGEVDAVGERPMRDRGEFGLRVARARRLEGDGAA